MPKATLTTQAPCDIPTHVLNLYVLEKNHLLPETEKPGISEVAARLVGLHDKRSQSPYLSLLARCPSFTAEQLEVALYHDRTLLRIHCMRGTVHMVALTQYETVVAATRGQLDGMYRRAFKTLEEKQRIEDRILELVKEYGPLAHTEIEASLDHPVEERTLYRLINELCTRRILVKATVKGTWRSSIYRYDLLARWQPAIPPGETDPLLAQAQLITWYLAAYGPATMTDIAWWTGFTQTQVSKAMGAMPASWICVPFAALGNDAYMLEDDFLRLTQWAPPPNPEVLLLPSFDPYIMAYAQRERYVQPLWYDRVFKGVAGIIEPVVLVDGAVIGTWKYEVVDDQLRVDLFKEKQPRQVIQKLSRVTKRVAQFLGDSDKRPRPAYFL